jgi:NTP pyrophosphatase (non-canonical NTP hydrolase)
VDLKLSSFQKAHNEWLLKNFPNVEPWEALAGIIEEVGELSHAHLKGHNKIRGLADEAEVRAAKADAIGDIFIYMASYCNTNGLDLELCIERAWQHVRRRDWRANPETGEDNG